MPVEASVSLRSESASPVGRERIRLLEAVAREGSITAAAKAVGLTYKAAWDALDAMANLFGRPLLETRTGGRSGGARLTAAGHSVVASYHRLEAELSRVLRGLEPDLAAAGLEPVEVLTGFLSRTSCRNAIRGRVVSVITGRVHGDVAVDIGGGSLLRSLITRDSVLSLGLCPGRDVIALIKASSVRIVDADTAQGLPARNRLPGTVSRTTVDGAAAEVVLTLAESRTLVASIAADILRTHGLRPGTPATAVIEDSHVILAVD